EREADGGRIDGCRDAQVVRGLDGVLDAGVLGEEPHGRHVARLADRLPHGDRAVVLEVGVLRAVAAGGRAHAGRVGLPAEVRSSVHDHRGRGRALLERGDVVEHLERGSRLAEADAGDVELALDARVVPVVVVDRADVREDLAVWGSIETSAAFDTLRLCSFSTHSLTCRAPVSSSDIAPDLVRALTS